MGSYLMLNSPSIGFVWIMRVFLMMALIIPILHRLLLRSSFIYIILTVAIFIGIQQISIQYISSIQNSTIQFILDETFSYALGYSSIAIIGLKIRTFKLTEILILILLSISVLITIVGFNNWLFDPQSFKYPPRSIYLVYGILISIALWILKPIAAPYTRNYVIKYLSENSMWIYLWHIIPVFLIEIIGLQYSTPWILRFFIILINAILLNVLYHFVIKALPKPIYDNIK